MIVSPGFRKFAIFLVIVAGVGLYWIIDNEKKETAKREQAEAAQQRFALTSIQPGDLLLSNVTLTKSNLYWNLRGTITNNSKFNLASIAFLVTIQDCPPSQSCKIVGQETPRITAPYDYRARQTLVPSGQVRQFESSGMKFENMPPNTSPRWEYKITEIRAAF